MKAIQITHYLKGPHELVVSNIPDLNPSPNDVVVQVHAAGANFFDLLQIAGKYQNQPPFPWILGAEFAGTVISAPQWYKYKKGDRVFGSTQGAYAEAVIAQKATLYPIPRGWSFRDAAGLSVTAPTSYAALVLRAKLRAGEICLVHAAAGGVSLTAVQIAKALGATVIATCSPGKFGVAKRFGADFTVDYTRKEWIDEVKGICKKLGKEGVDVVYDSVGKVEESLRVVAWNGRILIIGFAGGKIEKVAMNRVLLKNVSIVGLHWGAYYKNETQSIPGVWEGVYKLIDEGKLKPIVYDEESFEGLDSVGIALQKLGSRGTWGKVVVDIMPDAAKAKARL